MTQYKFRPTGGAAVSSLEALRENWWIYALALLSLLPIVLFRDFTPDNELRYMSIAKEALQHGSVFCFSNHGEVYADKPPMYLWVVMAGYRLFGMESVWFISLFSLIPMLLTGWVMDTWCAPYLTHSQRRVALLMLFTCGYFPGLGFILRMDMLMTLWIMLALREMWYISCDDNEKRAKRRGWLVGLYTFLALFTKGPLGLIIPLIGAAVCAGNKWRLFPRIFSWRAWTVLLLGCALWFGAVYMEGGAEYLSNLTVHQTVGRAHNAFHHKRPFWYYAVCIWYVMAPWSILMAVVAWKWRRKAVQGRMRRMLLWVSGITFLLLSCFSSKLQVYLLPIIPLMVYWCAGMISSKRWMRNISTGAYVILGLLFLAGLAIPFTGINRRIGYGEVCREVAKKHPKMVYVSKDVRRGENIDAYFSVPVVYTDSIPANPVQVDAWLIFPGYGGEKLSYKSLN